METGSFLTMKYPRVFWQEEKPGGKCFQLLGQEWSTSRYGSEDDSFGAGNDITNNQ